MEPPLSAALTSHQEGNLEKASELYHKILEENPNNVDVLYLLGILEAQRGNFKEALSLTERALELNPGSTSLYNSLGNILGQLGRLEEACLQYEKALQLNPNSVLAHNNLANALNKLNKFGEARKHYLEAISLKPDYLDAHYNLGLMLVKQGLDDEAMPHFLLIVQSDSKRINAHNQLAHIFLKKHKNNEAIEHYEAALKLDPNNIVANQNLGAILAEMGNFYQAIFRLQKALALDPHHIETLHNLGAIYLKRNDLNAALEYYLKLLPLVVDFDVYYNIGVIYMYQGKYGDALPYFLEALKLRPLDFATLSNLGAIYLKIEDYQKAALHYKQALKAEPKNQEIAYLLAAVSGKEGVASSMITAPKEYVEHLFDQYSPYFDKHLVQYLHYQVPSLLYDAVQKVLVTDNAKAEMVLDLGCGTGLAGEKFRLLAKKLIGVDLSQNMINLAKKKNIYDELLFMDMTEVLQSFDHNVDLIIAADSLVYSGALKEVFKGISKALKPGGYFAFTDEKTETYPYILQKTARFAHSKAYLDELIKKFGFTIEHEADDIVLRKQKDISIFGILYVLKH